MTINTAGFTIDTTAGLFVRIGRCEMHTAHGVMAPQWATPREPKSFTVFMGRRHVVLASR